MVHDYSKLKGRIVEKYDTNSAFSVALGYTNVHLSRKLNGSAKFSYDDIIKCQELLNIKKSEIGDYFFTFKV